MANHSLSGKRRDIMERQESNQQSKAQELLPVTHRRPKTVMLALIFACLLVVCAGLGLITGPQLMASDAKNVAPTRPPMPVETAEVRVADSDKILASSGSLYSKESVVIVAEIAGRIKEIGFIEGKKTKEGKMLIKLDSAVLQAELDRAVANRNLSKSNYKRADNLLKDHAISRQERDEAYASWQLDRANVRLAQAQLAKTIIQAPFAGTLGLRQVSLGDYVMPGQALVNLEAIEELKIEFSISGKHLAEVKTGQKIKLRSSAYPQQSFIGQIYAINPQINVQSRSLTVRGLLNNSKHQLLPGQFVKIQLSVGTRANALFIPEQALIPQPKTKLVFKVVNGKAQMVEVKTGTRMEGWVEITSGLSAGDIVVTGGHQKIGPGSPVQTVPADPTLFAKN
ncbi:related to multidrug-efflux transport protein A precursor [Desulfotalea psychrophila LSv54]|uniref:Related to multidrug-efflux transport protein A n=2 Tax=Desulfotalea psychrophila TaxID=84980 RepID=Q6ALC3_DESPS|nr:related to multidrug-efflux transport protein A precursor [Desulfotalea psychrophila LSv54]